MPEHRNDPSVSLLDSLLLKAEMRMAARILHISTWKVPCGIATYCDNFVRSLVKAGFENEVFPLIPSCWPDFLPDDIAEWRGSLLNKATGFDLVHIQHEHGLFGYALGQKFACKRYGSILSGLRVLNIPCVTTFHTDMETRKHSGLKGILNRFKRNRLWGKYVCDNFRGGNVRARAIVHTRRTRKSFVKHGFPVSSVHVIPHPCLSPRKIQLDSVSAKVSLNLPTDSKLITIFGFLGKYKGHDIAIEAMKKLPENYCLALVGGMHPEAKDSFLDSLVLSIPQDLQSRIRITGWVDRETADRYFAATDICLAPYRADTELSGSGAITWALSSGKPVIASKIDAFQNVNRISECMFMFTPGCVSELSWAIQKIANDRALSAMLVNRATEFCVSHSWDAAVADVINVYEEVGMKPGNVGEKVISQVA